MNRSGAASRLSVRALAAGRTGKPPYPLEPAAAAWMT